MQDNDPKTIVIVDDEMPFTDLLGRLLGGYFQCPVLTFGNPLTALAALPGLNVGVLITDYYMPHLNGLDLIRQAATLQTDAPASILMTGHLMEDRPEGTEDLTHFKAILPKPFHWQQLAALIETHWPADEGLALRGSPSSH